MMNVAESQSKVRDFWRQMADSHSQTVIQFVLESTQNVSLPSMHFDSPHMLVMTRGSVSDTGCHRVPTFYTV